MSRLLLLSSQVTKYSFQINTLCFIQCYTGAQKTSCYCFL